jgi:type VI secretion system protein ImpL
MMSLPRIFGLMLLFLFFEAVVAVVTAVFFPGTNLLLACLAMTALAVGTWMIFFLITRLLSKASAAKAAAPQKAFVPAPVKTTVAADSFTLEFTALINEANRRLQALATPADGRKQAPTVATLSLYLVVGAEGSGKTSAMLNSGMEPRLLAGEAQKDGLVLPTALANLWYAEGAIFVEFAGRVFQQEAERWEKALSILFQQQQLPWWKRQLYGEAAPVNLRGVLLACDADLFLQSRDVHRMGAMARTVNERLQSVQSAARADFPTYVLMTRTDSISYFQEFFSQLSDAESRRILGVTLPFAEQSNEYANVYSDREGGRLTKFFNRLYQSIADKRMLLLAREETPEKRALAYEFPREFKKIRGEVVQFLLDSFRPSAIHPPCRLRGVYFSGMRLVPRARATPDNAYLEESTIKKPTEATVFFKAPSRPSHRTSNASVNVTSTLDYSVVARPSSDTTMPKWTFLTDVFREIVLEDPAGKVAPVARRAGTSKPIQIALATVGAIFLLLSVLWVFSWQKNRSLLNDAQAAVAATSPAALSAQSPDGYLPYLSDLESLRPTLTRLHSYNHGAAPFSYHWGLYSGEEVANQLDRLYYARVRPAVLDPVLNAMSQRFLSLQPDAPDSGDTYRDLKSYLIVTDGSCKADGELVASTMLPVWETAVSRDPGTDAVAGRQIQFYTTELKTADPYGRLIPENTESVEKARLYLQGLKGPEQILQALINQVRQQPAERLSTYASNYAQVLTGPDQMDGPYTVAGWNGVEDSIRDHKIVSNQETCVVGNNSQVTSWGSSALDVQVQSRYSTAYAQQWKEFLAGHHVMPFASAQDAAQKLRTLGDNNRSPLLALVYMTSVNTNVAAPQGLLDRGADTVRNAAQGAGNKLKNLFQKQGDAPSTATAPTQPDAAPTVRASFDPVHVMVDPGSPNKWLNDKNQAYIKALNTLSDTFQTLPSQVHADVPAEVQQLQQANDALKAADEAFTSLAGFFVNTPSGVDVDLKNLLHEPIDRAQTVIAHVRRVDAPPPPGPAKPQPPPVDHTIPLTINKVNASMQSLCSAAAPLMSKFPFDATSTTDVTIDELNGLLQPGTGAYSRFANSPEAAKTYLHTGRTWAANPAFPATYSPTFLATLNNLAEAQDELYGQGTTYPHFNYTLSVDGSGKIAFELQVDQHTLKFQPGKNPPSQALVWPPITDGPTHLILKNGAKGTNQDLPPYKGKWSLFHQLDNIDSQNGNVFILRHLEIAHSFSPLKNEKGVEGTIQIRVDSPASNLFNPGYFAKLGCSDTWALEPQTPSN